METLKKLWEKINGWKTIAGGVITPIASAVVYVTPEHTLANQISMVALLLFGSLGAVGLGHKAVKSGKLPSGLRK